MRSYAKVAPQFWTGKTGKRLRGQPQLQVLAAYLMTSPHANMIGLYYLPLPTLSHETGLTTQGASKGLRSLAGLGFAHYDADTEHVWVPEMARFQVGERLAGKDRRIEGVVNEALSVRSSGFVAEFVARYRDDFALTSATRWPELERVSEGASKGHRSQEQEQEQEQDLEQEQEQEQDLEQEQEHEQRACARARVIGPDGFSAFWQRYPNHSARAVARKAWAKLQPDAEIQARIHAALDWQCASSKWAGDGGRFVPHASTYLNQRRWEDEPPRAPLFGATPKTAGNVAGIAAGLGLVAGGGNGS